MTRDPERRRSARSPVNLGGQCRTSAGLRLPVVVVDLSTDGCCILVSHPLREGQDVFLRPDTLSVISAHVQWRTDDLVGLKFKNPLYGPVYEHLARTFPRATAALMGTETQSDLSHGLPDSLRCALRQQLARAQAAEEQPIAEIEELYRSLPPSTPRPGLQPRNTSEKEIQLFLH